MNWRTKLLLVVTVVVAVAGGVRWLGRSSEPASAQGPPASARVATSRCDPRNPTKAEIGFGWYGSAPWDEAWLDLSLQNNGFIPGTFAGAGPIPPELTGNPSFEPYLAVYLWSGIEPGLTHYWRVNLRYGDTWYSSPTQTFVSPACGGGSATPPLTTPSDLEQRIAKLEGDLLVLAANHNTLVQEHNSLLAAHNDLVLKFNAVSRSHDDLAGAFNDLVGKFNRLVRQLQYGY